MIFSNRISPPISIKLGSTCLEKVSKTKYLGLYLDSGLKFNEHLIQLNVRLSQLRGITWRISSSLDFQAAKLFYYAFVQSTLSYCIEIWGGRLLVYQCSNTMSLINRIIRNLFSRHLSSNDPDQILSSLGVLKTRDLFKWKISQLFFNIRHMGYLPMLYFEYVEPTHNLRAQPELLVPFPRTDAMKINFHYCVTIIWNTIPIEIKNNTDLLRFKVAYKRHLLLAYAM